MYIRKRKRTPGSPSTVVQKTKKRRDREANSNHSSPCHSEDADSEPSDHDSRKSPADPFAGPHFEQDLALKVRIRKYKEKCAKHRRQITQFEDRLAEQGLVIESLIEQVLGGSYLSGTYPLPMFGPVSAFSNSNAGLAVCAKDRLRKHPLAAEKLHATLQFWVENKQEKWPLNPTSLLGILKETEELSAMLPQGPGLAYELVVSLGDLLYNQLEETPSWLESTIFRDLDQELLGLLAKTTGELIEQQTEFGNGPLPTKSPLDILQRRKDAFHVANEDVENSVRNTTRKLNLAS